jgi:hypothetical protein
VDRGEGDRAWHDQRQTAPELLLDTLTTYSATETIGLLLPYWAYHHAAGTPPPAGQPAEAPTAISLFGGEHVPFPKPPRALAEPVPRRHRLVPARRSGGHFRGVTEPRLLAETLRRVFRPLRRSG